MIGVSMISTGAVALSLVLLGSAGPGQTQDNDADTGDGTAVSATSEETGSEERPLWGGVVIDPDDAGTLGSDEYELTAAAIRSDTLAVTVSYGGGCQEHLFAVDASGAFRESDPVQLPVALAHEANDDACERWVTEDYRFDLTPLRERYEEEYKQASGVIVLLLDGASGEFRYEFPATGAATSAGQASWGGSRAASASAEGEEALEVAPSGLPVLHLLRQADPESASRRRL